MRKKIEKKTLGKMVRLTGISLILILILAASVSAVDPNDWSFGGNAFPGGTTQTLGTVTNDDVAIITNGVQRMIIDRSGNVGIGLAPGVFPAARLEVQGVGNTDNTWAFHVMDSAGATLMLVRDDGTVGIGTAAPGAKLDVAGDVIIQNSLNVDSNTLLVDDGNDMVGIGMVPTDTAYKLHVMGDVNITGQLNVSGNMSSGAIYSDDNRVGINTTTPHEDYVMTVSGDVWLNSSTVKFGNNSLKAMGDHYKITSDKYFRIIFDDNDETDDYFYMVGVHEDHEKNTPAYDTSGRFWIREDGKTGIGAQSPLGRLWVNTEPTQGTGTITSSGTTVNGSGTAFTTELKVGDEIWIEISHGSKPYDQQRNIRRVVTINNDTSLVVDRPFSIWVKNKKDPVQCNITSPTSFNYTRPILCVENNQRVGISTINPTEKLDVNGRVRVRDLPVNDSVQMVVVANATGVLHQNDGSFLKDHDWYEVGTTEQPDNINDNIFTDGKVGIGDTNPDAKLDILNNGTNASFRVDDSTDGDTTPFIIGNDGNVAIGTTTTTTYKVRIDSTEDNTGGLHVRGYNAIRGYTAWGGWGVNGYAYPSGGVDGFGVEGHVRYNNNPQHYTWSDGYAIYGEVHPYPGYGTNGPQTLYAGYFVGNVSVMNGNVGIGTADPGAELEIAGQIMITGGSPGSDRVLTSDANGLASWQDRHVFYTIDTPYGSDPVADGPTDTLQFLTEGIIDINGVATNDRIIFNVTEEDGNVTNELQNLQEVYEHDGLTGNNVQLACHTGGNIRFYNDGGDEILFLNETNGHIGIGSATPRTHDDFKVYINSTPEQTGGLLSYGYNAIHGTTAWGGYGVRGSACPSGNVETSDATDGYGVAGHIRYNWGHRSNGTIGYAIYGEVHDEHYGSNGSQILYAGYFIGNVSVMDGRMGIGIDTPQGILDVSSTTSGLIVPRMTQAQRNGMANPVDGMIVYDTTNNQFYFRENGVWVNNP